MHGESLGAQGQVGQDNGRENCAGFLNKLHQIQEILRIENSSMLKKLHSVLALFILVHFF